MKKYFLFLLGLMFLCSIVNAQYEVNKTKYDYHNYVYEAGDPYRPVFAGVTSFLVPGLGQMISGEFDRGLNFLGGYVGCWSIYFGYKLVTSSMVGMFVISSGRAGVYAVLGETIDPEPEAGPLVLLVIGLTIIETWAVVDAIRVAKINNLAWRDMNKTGYNIDIQPYINRIQSNNRDQPQMGLTVTVNF